jgi:hypothetical protein
MRTPAAPPSPPRFMALVLHAAAEQLQLRIIAPDRPGIGLSTALHSRTVQQYPADLAELCDQLGGSEGGCEGSGFLVQVFGFMSLASGLWVQHGAAVPSRFGRAVWPARWVGRWLLGLRVFGLRFFSSSERHCSGGLHQQLVSLLQQLLLWQKPALTSAASGAPAEASITGW